MQFEKLIKGTNSVFEERREHNIDLWRATSDFFSKSTNISNQEFNDSIVEYMRKRAPLKTKLDKILDFQKKYRFLFGWDKNIESIVNAFGFYIQRSPKFADYVYERIISEEREDNYREEDLISCKYFLVICLTIAARTSVYAFKLFWNIHWSSWAINWIWNLSPKERKELGEEYFDLDRNVHEALNEGLEKFDIASPEIITFLLSKINDSFENIPGLMWRIFDNILGDNPNVKCMKIDKQGNLLFIMKDFSVSVLSLLKNPNLLGGLERVFSKWCKNDRLFKQKVVEEINSKGLTISYLTYFLIKKLKKATNDLEDTKEVAEELKNISEETRKQKINSFYLVDWSNKIDHIQEQEKFVDFLRKSIEDLKDKKIQEKSFELWLDYFYTNRGNRYSFFGEAEDYINYNQSNFKYRVLS